MNAPSPSPLPSPLVPQGSIPPKGASRSGRVLLIALTVFGLHLGGLSLVLLQGCQKDAKTAGAETTTTNLTYAPLTPDTNSAAPAASQYYTSASNLPPASTYTPGTNPAAVAAAASNPFPAQGNPGFAEPPTNVSTPTTATETGPTTEYKVAARDTLDGIARKHHVTLKAVKDANPNVDPAKLKVGQVLKIPAVPLPTLAVASTGRTAAAATGGTTAAAPAAGSYKVKTGDTLTKIARNNGITVAQLRAANNMKTTRISVGQTLKIPGRSTAAAPSGTTPQ